MTHDELLEDTNRLLKQLVEMDEERKVQAVETRKNLEAMRQDPEEMRRKLLGGTGERPAASDLDARRDRTLQQSRENLEAMAKRAEQFNEDLLAELRKQSEILKRIAEKLEQ